MGFRDHFSKLALNYAQYRPGYPAELFEYLASISPGRELAWDCGTGNGQAAAGLAQYFLRVVATDASPDQIARAYPHEKVEYRVEPAERVSLDSNSCDLVTVAIAVHWFDLEPFYEEVKRVLKPGGVLALWTYHLPVIEPAVDQALFEYYTEVLAGYWPQRFHYVDERYQTLPFPFEEIVPPEFVMEAEWDLDQLTGFLVSWSATQRYLDREGRHPLEVIWPELSEAWGERERRRIVRWPLYLRLGKVALHNRPSP